MVKHGLHEKYTKESFTPKFPKCPSCTFPYNKMGCGVWIGLYVLKFNNEAQTKDVSRGTRKSTK